MFVRTAWTSEAPKRNCQQRIGGLANALLNNGLLVPGTLQLHSSLHVQGNREVSRETIEPSPHKPANSGRAERARAAATVGCPSKLPVLLPSAGTGGQKPAAHDAKKEGLRPQNRPPRVSFIFRDGVYGNTSKTISAPGSAASAAHCAYWLDCAWLCLGNKNGLDLQQ